MKHDTAKKGQPRYFVGLMAWRNFRDNNNLIPTAMSERFHDSWHPAFIVYFYEYPDGFYGGLPGRQLWRLNSTHRDWVMRVMDAMAVR